MATSKLPERVGALLERQHDVARLDQFLEAGLTRQHLADEVRFGRWQRLGPTVLVAHNGPVTAGQQDWAAVLGCGPRAALCGRSAARYQGLDGWDDGLLHVVVERGTTPPTVPLPVKVHESRRYRPATDRHPVRTPPMTSAERSVIDAATWTLRRRSACGLVVASVQQRVTTAQRLMTELDSVGYVRHRNLIQRVLADIDGGSQALSEVDFGRMCQRHGLPQPARQSVRRDAAGRRRYVDVEMRSRRGKTWLIEIDGAVHLLASRYWNDMNRANDLVIAGDSILRFPAAALYFDEAGVVAQVRRAIDD